MQVTACSAGLRRRFSFFSFFLQHEQFFIFFVCVCVHEGVLSLVNYTQRYARQRGDGGGAPSPGGGRGGCFFFFWLLFNSEAFWHRGRHRAGAEWRRAARVAEMCSLKGGMNLTWSSAGKNKTCTVSAAFFVFFSLGRDANQANEPLRLIPRVRECLGEKKSFPASCYSS